MKRKRSEVLTINNLYRKNNPWGQRWRLTKWTELERFWLITQLDLCHVELFRWISSILLALMPSSIAMDVGLVRPTSPNAWTLTNTGNVNVYTTTLRAVIESNLPMICDEIWMRWSGHLFRIARLQTHLLISCNAKEIHIYENDIPVREIFTLLLLP